MKVAAHNNTFLNEDETSLYWRTDAMKEFHIKEGKLNPDFKASQDRLTPLC